MPIPAAPPDRSFALAVLALFHQLHDQVRDELAGLRDDDLHWAPGEHTNTIATIVVHMIGSEAETMNVAAGRSCVRDRDAEFVPSDCRRQDLLDLLSSADALLEDVAPSLDDGRLWASAHLPTLPPEEERPLITWLIGNYGHAREHVGHIQLTKQLRQRDHSTDRRP